MVEFFVYGGSNLSPVFWRSFCDYADCTDNIESHVICFDEIKAKDYRKEGFDVTCLERILRGYGKQSTTPSETLSTLREFEQETDTLVMDLIQADRHLGRGCYTSGTRHPRSTLSEIRSYEDTAQLISQYIHSFNKLFNQFKPDVLLMGGVASLPTKLLCVCARNNDVEIRILRGARINNRYLWTVNEFGEVPTLSEEFEIQQFADEIPDSTYESHKVTRERFTDYFSLQGCVHSSIRQIKKFLGNKLYRDSTKPSTYKLTSDLKAVFNRYRDYRHLMKLVDSSNTTDFGEYVFYPLQVEPEASLMVFSPEFNNQQALIDATAKALPAGYKLIVKEHIPAIGRRPVNFYDRIDEMPNVVLVSPHKHGIKLAQNSIATVTITGTPGLEAAIAGVPVITPGKHNMYNIINHVHQTTDFSNLRKTVQMITNTYEDEELLEKRRNEGKRFVAALNEVSFDLGEESSIIDGTQPSEEITEVIYTNLIQTL